VTKSVRAVPYLSSLAVWLACAIGAAIPACGDGSPAAIDAGPSATPDSPSSPPPDAAVPDSSVGGDAQTAPDAPASGPDAGDGGDAGLDSSVADAASKGAAYICAPGTRTLSPVAVFSTTGTVANPSNLLTGAAASLTGAGSSVVLDFGTEVGGIVSVTFAGASDENQSIGIAFSESSLYVGPSSDQSNGGSVADGAIIVPVAGASTYTLPPALLRGGFRYLTLFISSAGSVDVSGVSLAYSPDPNRPVPNQYPNYFYSNDETLNHIWYAGAYTFQTNVIGVDQGREWPAASANWDNAVTVGELGNTVLVDGAKRDRTVWPGDMGISAPTGYVSLFETEAVKDSLQTLFNHQDSQGQLPFAGPEVNYDGSDTYHMWTLIGAELYYLYSGDKAWLDGIWASYALGMEYILAKVDGNGLLDVTGTADWARDNQGGENIEANAILYGLLTRAAYLAEVENDGAHASSYAAAAASLQTQIQALLWDSTVGAFRDNPTSSLYPQDGNALAAWFGVVAAPTQAKGLSYVLDENWNGIGSRGPEFTFQTGTPRISPFAGSMELMGHFTLGYDTRALELIRMMWGFMLSSPNGTGCTFWEGYNSDGSFCYSNVSVSYTSLSHGWSTGPTSALTFYVLGVAPDTAAGQTYHVVPHPGDLTHAEGDLTLAAGKTVTVSYDVSPSCTSFSLHVDASTNTGSVGTIAVPTFGATHTVQIDGVTAWNGSSFVATAGIGGANADASYVYFTGVAPGTHTFAYDDGSQCPPAPEEWTFCSDENGQCAFTGTKRVRFGKQGAYDYGIFTGGTPCSLATFGPDPIANVAKSCQTSDDLYTICAAEGGTCATSATNTQVRFGANGQWRTQSIAGGASMACTASAFGGDPITNVVKRCETR
jgi:alpha-L-rhamnosidase-like protein